MMRNHATGSKLNVRRSACLPIEILIEYVTKVSPRWLQLYPQEKELLIEQRDILRQKNLRYVVLLLTAFDYKINLCANQAWWNNATTQVFKNKIFIWLLGTIFKEVYVQSKVLLS